MLEFMYPKMFWILLVLVPWLAYELLYKRKRKARLSFSNVQLLKEVAGHSSFWEYFPLIIRTLVIILLVVAIARPRLASKEQQIKGKGIDIMLVLDVSGSMRAIDFRPGNRLEAAKKVAEQFIDNRKNDRIGLIKFSTNAFTQCPLTLDYNIINTILEGVNIDEQGGSTAIGLGLATAVARLRDSEAKSKVIILITDGSNNAGEIDPNTAADLAATYDIKVYPIGVGKEGEAEIPVETRFGTQYRKIQADIDMETLNKIAQVTGTNFARRARNTDELEAIMKRIDELEKTEIKIKDYYEYEELFWNYLLAAMILLGLELLFRLVIRKEIP